MKSFKVLLLLSAFSAAVVGQEIAAATESKSEESKSAQTASMVSLVPYYFDNGQYSMLLLKEADNKLHTAAMPKKEDAQTSKYKDILLQWIGEKFTPAAKALTAAQDNDKSFVSEDGTTVYLVKVNKAEVNETGVQWVTEADLHAKAKAGALSSDAKEVYLSREWNDIVNSSRSVKKAAAKPKKSKKVHA